MAKQEEIIQLLIQNELILNELYSIYVKKFPEEEYFWNRIASDEIDHANWIKELYIKVKTGGIYFNEKRFNPEALKTYFDYVNSKKESVKEKDLSLLLALSTAYDLEKSLIERKYFEVFEHDSIELKNLLLRLEVGVEHHLKYVKNRLEEENKKLQTKPNRL